VESSAYRELKEETGYTISKILKEIPQPKCFNDPCKSTGCSKIYVAEVDMEHPDNKNPQQNLELGEMIQGFLFDLGKGNLVFDFFFFLS